MPAPFFPYLMTSPGHPLRAHSPSRSPQSGLKARFRPGFTFASIPSFLKI